MPPAAAPPLPPAPMPPPPCSSCITRCAAFPPCWPVIRRPRHRLRSSSRSLPTKLASRLQQCDASNRPRRRQILRRHHSSPHPPLPPPRSRCRRLSSTRSRSPVTPSAVARLPARSSSCDRPRALPLPGPARPSRSPVAFTARDRAALEVLGPLGTTAGSASRRLQASFHPAPRPSTPNVHALHGRSRVAIFSGCPLPGLKTRRLLGVGVEPAPVRRPEA